MEKLFIILTKIMIGEQKLDMGDPKTPEQPKKPQTSEQEEVSEQKEKSILDSSENKTEQEKGKQKKEKGEKKKDVIDKVFDKIIDVTKDKDWKIENDKRFL